ncbi:hypothetical protein Metlim_2268 [Methanoplanus limicola DSM 2279]|uniref:Uncharacterized protein n=1 Tax=Methanoplanus limicola DSM 2279 TaxID=937775 RepID=H1Z1I0_9EURY|nr:hypothetical protein Metlim_2268 [Methanoplanus limicola DSM 2279]
MMPPVLKVFAPCIAGAAFLFIVNAVVSGSGWLLPTVVIAGIGCITAGVIVMNDKRNR